MRIKVLERLDYLLFATLLLASCMPVEERYHMVVDQVITGSIPVINPAEVGHLPDNTVIIDVRSREEFEVSHLPGARFSGYASFDSKDWETVDPDKPVVVYCTMGFRSEQVGTQLKKHGYLHVYNLYGGIIEWKNSGYEVVDSSGAETDSVHGFDPLWGSWLTNGIAVYE